MTYGEAWDAHPREVEWNGIKFQAFTRTALGLALGGRTNAAIRALERRGVLCRPELHNGFGVWLYTRDQIESLVALAKEEGVIDPRYRRPFSERFKQQAHEILHRLPS